MKVSQSPFLEVMGTKDAQFVIPPFQRVYSWTPFECQELFDDVTRAGKLGNEHFMGAFLYSPIETLDDGVQRFQIIDGQQRFTTMTLLIKAYADHCEAAGNAERAQELAQKYLTCGPDSAWPKLLMTLIDRDMLAYILGLAPEPEDTAARLQENLDVFKDNMSKPSFDAEGFWDGIQQLQVVVMELEKGDAPQEVFESLNSKGKRLAIEDLLRNAILLDASEQDNSEEVSTEIYNNLWLPMESLMDTVPDADMEDLICAWMASIHSSELLQSKSRVYTLLKGDLAKIYGGNYAKLLRNLSDYANRFASNGQFRRDQMDNMKRWLQGKPKNIISEHKIFGD